MSDDATSRALEALQRANPKLRIISGPIHPWRWRLLALWLVVFTAVTATALRVAQHQADEGDRAHDALCALRANLEAQVASSRAYLNDLQTGVRRPIPGISAADIQAGIRRQDATIHALEDLQCPPPPQPITTARR